MSDSFAVPAGAQPLSGTMVPGLVTAAMPEQSGTTGPVVDKSVDLRGDKPEEVKAKEPIVLCPACGAAIVDKDEVMPTEEEKDAWLRHILGEGRFVRTYTLFEGRVTVTFRSRKTHENDAIFNQLMLDVRNGAVTEIAGVVSPSYYSLMNRYMLAYSLERLEFSGKSNKMAYPEVTAEAYPVKDEKDIRSVLVRAHDSLVLPLAPGLLAAIVQLQRRFDALLTTLLRHSDDPGFWTPTVAGT